MQRERRNDIESTQHLSGESTVLPRAPHLVEVEEKCEECGGSGYDCGSLSPIEPEDCPVCQGSGKQIVTHNYLAEALRIAAGNSAMHTQREHLVAVIQHCRGLVGAVIGIADIR
jgi:DnaJ-class molecular chaperone